MTIDEEKQRAGTSAEYVFRQYCDSAGVTYLYVDQSCITKSSKVVQEQAQRPDFLVIEPNKMPFFIDVKAHDFRTSDGKSNLFYKEFYGANHEAIFWSCEEYKKLLGFQSLIGIPVWIAWFERNKELVRKQFMYVIPLNIVTRFFTNSPWWFFQIPLDCSEKIDLKKPDPLNYCVPTKTVEQFGKLLDKVLKKKK
ncbi:MAG: hypothetical protein ABIH76_06225 [Candidatus Bathyarchaeota archaeon]